MPDSQPQFAPGLHMPPELQAGAHEGEQRGAYWGEQRESIGPASGRPDFPNRPRQHPQPLVPIISATTASAAIFFATSLVFMT